MQFSVGHAGQSLGGFHDVVDPGQLPGDLGHLVLVEHVDGATVDNQLKDVSDLIAGHNWWS